ncbi:MAG: sodium/proton-translocating pyrophosphatase, partial [Planctomycetaceae bacterium]|nr:sodium/proton-translocating pyrophosphatase [Planctomycetaceae bacterium]
MKRACLRGVCAAVTLIGATPLMVSAGEADLDLPPLPRFSFEWNLLFLGMLVCVVGLAFGYRIYRTLRQLPVHPALRDVSELIYGTCKTYLWTQGKLILMLELIIGSIMAYYFGVLEEKPWLDVGVILLFSMIGIAGSFGVAWFGIRVNTLANGRAAFAALKGKPFPVFDIPLQAGISIGMMLISVELLMMLAVLLLVPRHLAGPCFIGFAIGESLGASALRIAGGIFTKIADIGA